jgi:UDP-N-acetylmuramyl-tripeptide synthetase
MTLNELGQKLQAVTAGDLDAEVTDICYDSRACTPGSVFVAIAGAKLDGNDFVSQAIERGAVAVISENPCPTWCSSTWLQVADARRALAAAAAEVFEHPSGRLALVGVTGTNGKTTTSYLVDSIFQATGGPSALLSTIIYRCGADQTPAERTTPEASDVQRFLHRALRQGCQYAVMEVSSHALDLKRVDGCHFSVAVFTNFTQDHLDYHGTMEEYFAAKRKLFDGTTGSPPKVAVINLDDPRADALITTAMNSGSRVLTYGLHPDADVRALQFQLSAQGLEFVAHTPLGHLPITSSLVGKPHVYNILAAVATGLSLDFRLDTIARGTARCAGVPGRFEAVQLGQDFAVVVDYAHTQDALHRVLETARQLTSHRLITLFGCGGDRDATKRAPMGETAARLSDVVIVTSDNPRTEDPEAIIQDIEVGLKRVGRPYSKIVDRREAIHRAIDEGQSGDIVVLAGKGHETYQILKGGPIPFDDREVAREAIAQRLKTQDPRPRTEDGSEDRGSKIEDRNRSMSILDPPSSTLGFRRGSWV